MSDGSRSDHGPGYGTLSSAGSAAEWLTYAIGQEWPESAAPAVFLSFCKQDVRWVHELQPWLDSELEAVICPHTNTPSRTVHYADRKHGTAAAHQFTDALARDLWSCRAAVVLLSQDYVQSDICYRIELPFLAWRHFAHGMPLRIVRVGLITKSKEIVKLPQLSAASRQWPDLDLQQQTDDRHPALNAELQDSTGGKLLSELPKGRRRDQRLRALAEAVSRDIAAYRPKTVVATTAKTDTEGSPPGPDIEDRHNLPLEATTFIGRDDEVNEIRSQLRERRRLTLVGSPGVGKTRTALRVGLAERDAYRDGVWFVELAPLSDTNLVAEAICRVISAPVSNGRSAVDVAVTFLRQKQALLILDNCEHLLAGAAELAAAILARCPHVSLLATSRERLHIPGELVYRLPSLPTPREADGKTAAGAMRFGAVELFVRRASDAVGGYTLTDADAPVVAKICRRLDGVALAIELAAARMRMLNPAEIALRLEDAFRLLNIGNKATVTRHQTLWATIDWSHSLLLPQEQTVLRRLSVFVDGFSLDGATATASGDGIDPDDVLDNIQKLVDKSLINVDKSNQVTRYRMLEATREYARDKLKVSGDSGQRARAAAYLAAFYQRAEVSWPTTPTDTWLNTFGFEIENLRAAIGWAFEPHEKRHDAAADLGDASLGLELVAHAGSIAEEMSLQADMQRWTQAALARITPATPPAIAGWLRFWATKWQVVFGAGAISENRRLAIALFRQAGDMIGLSRTLRTTAMAIARPGQMPPEVAPMLTEAIQILRPTAPTKDLATALSHMGSYCLWTNDLAGAQRYYSEAHAMSRGLGDRTGTLACLLNLAELEFQSGQPQKAIACAREALAVARRAGSAFIEANLLHNVSGYLLSVDEIDEGRTAACDALRHFIALDHRDWAMLCIEHLALANALSGSHRHAARLFGYVEHHFQLTNQARDLLEQVGHERLAELLKSALPPELLNTLTAEGAAWSDEVAQMAAQDEFAGHNVATAMSAA